MVYVGRSFFVKPLNVSCVVINHLVRVVGLITYDTEYSKAMVPTETFSKLARQNVRGSCSFYDSWFKHMKEGVFVPSQVIQALDICFKLNTVLPGTNQTA